MYVCNIHVYTLNNNGTASPYYNVNKIADNFLKRYHPSTNILRQFS